MSFIAHLAKERQGEPFDPGRDSRLASRPIYADFMKALNTLQCAFCSMDLVFLMQLATPYKDAVRRVLLVFFCPNHAETNEGWYIQRYTVGVTDTAHTTKVSAFDEMNALSSWVSDLELYPSKKNDTASAVTDSFTTTTVDNDSAHRIMVEEDFVTPSAPQPVDGDTERLFAAYKQRSREDVDEEDHLDIDTIEYHCDPDASSDSSADESDVARVDPMLLEFQQYVSMRPKSVLRYDWSGRPLVLESGFHFGSHCFGCGGECVFEFQLLPAFMKHISRQMPRRVSMHIASILFYTCEFADNANRRNAGRNDCDTGADGLQEHAIVLLYV